MQYITFGSDYKTVTLISKSLRDIITKIHPDANVKLCSNLWTLIKLHPLVNWDWRRVYSHRETTIPRLQESWLQPKKPKLDWLRVNPNVNPRDHPQIFPTYIPKLRYQSNSNNKDFATWENVISGRHMDWDWVVLFERENFIDWERFTELADVLDLCEFPWDIILMRDELYEGLRNTQNPIFDKMKEVICDESEDGYLFYWHTQYEFIKRFGGKQIEDWENICLYSDNHRVATWEFVSQNKVWWNHWNWNTLSAREDFVTPERVAQKDTHHLWDFANLLTNPSYINTWDRVIAEIEEESNNIIEDIFRHLSHNRAIATWENIFKEPKYIELWNWTLLSMKEDLTWKIVVDNPMAINLWDWEVISSNCFGKN